MKEATTVTIESPFVDPYVLQGDLIKPFKPKEFLSSVPWLVDRGLMFTVISSNLMSLFGPHLPSEFDYCLSRAGQPRSSFRFSVHLKSYMHKVR